MQHVEDRPAGDVYTIEVVEVLVRDDDFELLRLLAGAGFVAGEERSGITWMDAEDRPDVRPSAGGIRARGPRPGTARPHPMRRRSGEAVEARLRQCSLYDPALDLAVETADGQVAGYALFWFDPVTEIGMVER